MCYVKSSSGRLEALQQLLGKAEPSSADSQDMQLVTRYTSAQGWSIPIGLHVFKSAAPRTSTSAHLEVTCGKDRNCKPPCMMWHYPSGSESKHSWLYMCPVLSKFVGVLCRLKPQMRHATYIHAFRPHTHCHRHLL